MSDQLPQSVSSAVISADAKSAAMAAAESGDSGATSTAEHPETLVSSAGTGTETETITAQDSPESHNQPAGPKHSPEALKEITRLSKARREAEKKARDLEAKAKELETKLGNPDELTQRASELVRIKEEIARNPGKVFEMLGVDFNTAISSYLTPESVDPKVQALNEKVEALNKRLEAEDKAKAEAAEQSRQESLNSQTNQTLKVIQGIISKDTNRWELCSKEPSSAELAFKAAHLAVSKLGRPVTEAEAQDLVSQALDAIESDLESLGKKYQKSQPTARIMNPEGSSKYLPQKPRDNRPRTIDSSLPHSNSSGTTTVKTGPLTREEAKARALELLNRHSA